jgi:hypothetical protein
MEDCEIAADGDLAFEDSTVNATITSHVTSIKNPRSGCIKVASVGEIIHDKYCLQPDDCQIITTNK